MLKNFIIAGLLISHNVSLLCARPITAGMTAITTWRDALPFKSKIVAYVNLSASYLHRGYVLNPNYHYLSMGYISDRIHIINNNGSGMSCNGFNIQTLVKANSRSSDHDLSSSELDEADMHMRLATKSELLKLRKLFNRGTVKFASMDKESALKQINDQLS